MQKVVFQKLETHFIGGICGRAFNGINLKSHFPYVDAPATNKLSCREAAVDQVPGPY
ncbi:MULTISPECIES: hypothetical protein [unclassified Tardiphaga]|uniref:hypothetical protein n=1 Tax=unclassified Tardiphaga TaxID=2631404 RepID=UPI00143CC14B|nr:MULTISPECIES: hypothetical protein [unclassified Tardiphaga]